MVLSENYYKRIKRKNQENMKYRTFLIGMYSLGCRTAVVNGRLSIVEKIYIFLFNCFI